MHQPSKRIQFSYFLLHKMHETRFRLSEILNVCQTSRRRFAEKQPPDNDDCRMLNFHFSAFSSLVQTIKDILPTVAGQKVSWTALSNVRHMQFMHAVRNAITHDGNPVINLWVDGRYYIACDFLRLDQNQNPVLVQAPTEDIETLVTQLIMDLCTLLRSLASPLLGSQELTGPLYGEEFFDNAINHPAIPKFAKRLYAEADRSSLGERNGDPVAELLNELDDLICLCHPQE